MTLQRFDPTIASPFNDIGAQPVALDPSKDYTISLTIIGSQLHGQVFEIGGGMVAENFATDATYTSGYSGLMGLSVDDGVDPPEPTVDFTVDNFRTEDVVAGIPGDYNNNSKVDAADYVVWRKNETANNALPNDNGLTTQTARFTLWRSSFGNPPGSGAGLGGSSSVPEPTGGALVVLGFACSCFACRRRYR